MQGQARNTRKLYSRAYAYKRFSAPRIYELYGVYRVPATARRFDERGLGLPALYSIIKFINQAPILDYGEAPTLLVWNAVGFKILIPRALSIQVNRLYSHCRKSHECHCSALLQHHYACQCSAGLTAAMN